MKIDVVSLKLERTHAIEIDAEEEYVYGVETGGAIFCKSIGDSNVECVGLLCLDSTNKIINYSITSIGDIANVRVSISQIVKTALLSNSSKIIIAHNHPSGVLEITSDDIDMTRLIASIVTKLEIELIDSLVVNGTKAVSIREKMVK